MAIEVTVNGPLFTGATQRAIGRAAVQIEHEVGQQVLADVHWTLNRRIKHPTPYYETQIIMQPVGSDIVVHDRGIIYGPWLEGVSFRNQTTRFKGYHAFREAFREAREYAQPFAERILRRFVPELR